ncbi:hypothetical protein K431DRAFT_145150 [Polychaeton citri CBS 116435]|uniref:Zn(2)-C6 fungal-type domain-containing protein n=1 Tax=Polychaeton citri CBS 116435 TaxID=1314669 RepID=A0A9P4QDM1_9PEZI|nr:hypothetical protein K431DRAFT_145150 [Polychaeton citri CBS 116435]
MESQRQDPVKPHPCDQCRRRKVRCNYATPCDRCTSYGLTCTRELIRKKRGPKKGRGTILQQLRSETHRSPPSTSTVSHAKSPAPEINDGSNTSMVRSPRSDFVQRQDAPNPSPEMDQRSHHHRGSRGSLVGHGSVPTSSSRPLAPLNWAHSPPSLDPLDDYFTFDEFTQSVLAGTAFANPHDHDHDHSSHHGSFSATGPDIPGLLNHATPQSMPAVSPYDTNLNAQTPQTPHTGRATIAAAIGPDTDFQATSAIIQKAVDHFFTNMYPVYPIVLESRVRGWLQHSPTPNRSEACLVWAICALTLTLCDDWPGLGSEQRSTTARRFMRRILVERLDIPTHTEAPMDPDIITSLFLATTYFDLKQRNTSSFYLRESITQSQILHRRGEAYGIQTEEEMIMRKRTLALLFITDRGNSVLHGFPVTFALPPSMPSEVLAGEDPTIALGLRSLHGLFALLDQKFVRLWSEQSYDAFVDRGLGDLSLLQEHLRQPISTAGITDIQRADILITQQWLRLVFWQAGLRQGLISTTATDPAFTYVYPIEIAMKLCDIVKTLPPVAVQVHGLGVFEKVFEIAYSLMDTLTLSGTSQAEHQECLRYLLLSLSASPKSRQIYVKTLEKKMDDGPQKYRHLANVQLLREDNPKSHGPSKRQSPAVGENNSG